MEQYLEDILKRYDSGESLREIARQYEANHSTIRAIIKKYREVRVPRGRQPEIVEQVYPLFEAGYSVKEIELKLGIPNSTVRTILKRDHGVTFTSEINPKKYEHLQKNFIEDYQSGLTLAQIGEKYGVNAVTVLNYLNNQQLRGRSYSETGRIYETNEDYFDELTPKKSFQIGMIYAMGRLIKRANGKSIRLHKTKCSEHLIVEALDGITTDINQRLYYNASDIASIDVFSGKLHDLFLNWGFPNHPPQAEGLDIDAFWEGLIYANAIFHKTRRWLMIPFESPKLKEFGVEYLENNFKELKNMRRSKRISWSSEKEITEILKVYPILARTITDSNTFFQ